MSKDCDLRKIFKPPTLPNNQPSRPTHRLIYRSKAVLHSCIKWADYREGSKSIAVAAGHCTARQCSPLRRKFMECSISIPRLSLLMKHLVTGQRQKAPNFSAFHWSPHATLVSIGQHFVTTRVVHLPKRIEASLITKSDQSGPNHQLLQLCTACTAWSDSEQAVRAVHSCSSWLPVYFINS